MSTTAQKETTGIRVLVYGSLRKGFGNHRLLEGSKFLGDYTISASAKLKLVSLGWFPGVIQTTAAESTAIVTEGYLVSADTLRSLDVLEGHPSFYTRIKIASKWKNAWIYTLQEKDYGKNDRVESGDWAVHVKKGAG